MKRKSLILIGALSFFSLFLITSLGLGLYFTSQPSRCQFCHIIRKDYQAWQKSSHKGINCANCHSEPGIVGFSIHRLRELNNAARFLFGLYQKPISSVVKNSSCLACHKEIKKGVLVKDEIRVDHKHFLEKGSWCTDCHNTVAHLEAVPKKNYPTADKCTECHQTEDVSPSCPTCHIRDMAGKEDHTIPLIGGRTDSLATHRIPETWRMAHGKFAVKRLSLCYLCHIKSTCLRCHQIEMPHPDSFPPQHPIEIQKKGEKLCYNCHRIDDCQNCHSRHLHPPVNCRDCHRLRGE